MAVEFKEAVVTVLEAASSGLGGFLGDPRIQGVLLGSLLTQGAAFFKDWLATKKQAKAVRKILRFEIENNLIALKSLRDFVVLYKPLVDEASDDSEISAYTTTFIDLLVYRLQRKAFESQVPLLPVVLSGEEIVKVYEFYSAMSSASAVVEAAKQTPSETSMMLLRDNLEFLLNIGNPLSKTKPVKAEPTEKPSGTS